MAAVKKIVKGSIKNASDFMKSFGDKIYYHFSESPDIKKFKINQTSPFDDYSKRGSVYFTSDPKYANEIGEEIFDQSPLMEGSIYPVKIKKDRIFNHKNKLQIKKLLKEMLDNPKQYETEFNNREIWLGNEHHKSPTIKEAFEQLNAGDYNILEAPRIQKSLKEQGYRGYTTSEPGTVGLFYPDQGDVRSVFAKFDPSKAKSGNILASVPIGYGALNMIGEDDGQSID